MKPGKKPFAIYRWNQYQGKDGFWERASAYETASAAAQALIDLTRKPKAERIFTYIILPNETQERWILVKDHKKLLESAR
jgi:hypothetical protein